MKNLIKLILFIFCLLTFKVFSQPAYNEFIIGSFRNPDFSMTDRNYDISLLQLAKDAGLNTLTYVHYYDPKSESFNDYLLDITSEVGLNYVVNDSRHMITSDWQNTTTVETFDPSIANTVTNHYTSLSSNLRNALFGYYIKDEPSPTTINSTHLPVVQSWVNHFRTYDNTKHSLVDLLPIYATFNPNLDKPGYIKYLDDYLNNPNSNLNPDIAAINVYLRAFTSGDIEYFYNLNLFREKAKGRPMWGHVDVNRKNDANVPFVYSGSFFNPDESYIRFSVNSYLSYGFKGIIYFPYDHPYDDYGLTKAGVPTNKYYWVQKLNNYIKNVVAPMIMSTDYIGTYHKGDFLDKDGSTLEVIPNNQKFLSGNVPYVDDVIDNRIMISVFADASNGFIYLYIVNKGFLDDHANITTDVYLKGNQSGRIYTYPTTGPSWAPITVNSSLISNKTKFTISNLKPGEGRLYRINFNNILAQPTISMSGGYLANPTLTYSTASEIKYYVLKKEYDFGSGYGSPFYVNPASNPYTDNNVQITRFGGDLVARYSVKAVDYLEYESQYSNTVQTSGQSLWKNNSEQNDNEVIKEYALKSNYPNPFNPTTIIEYQIPKDSFVNLIVYNSLGQIVAKLVNQNQTSGKYSIKFDASSLPSGAYMYKLKANEFSLTKKMILAK